MDPKIHKRWSKAVGAIQDSSFLESSTVKRRSIVDKMVGTLKSLLYGSNKLSDDDRPQVIEELCDVMGALLQVPIVQKRYIEKGVGESILDVAAHLIHMAKGLPSMADVALSLIPAFHALHPKMAPRLLDLFTGSIFRSASEVLSTTLHLIVPPGAQSKGLVSYFSRKILAVGEGETESDDVISIAEPIPALFSFCDHLIGIGLAEFHVELLAALATGPPSGHEAASGLLLRYWSLEKDFQSTHGSVLPKLWDGTPGSEYMVMAIWNLLRHPHLGINERGFLLLDHAMDWKAAEEDEHTADMGALIVAVTSWIDHLPRGSIHVVEEVAEMLDVPEGAPIEEKGKEEEEEKEEKKKEESQVNEKIEAAIRERNRLLYHYGKAWLSSLAKHCAPLLVDAMSPLPNQALRIGRLWRPTMEAGLLGSNEEEGGDEGELRARRTEAMLVRIWVVVRVVHSDAIQEVLDELLPQWADFLSKPKGIQRPSFWESVRQDVLPPFADPLSDYVAFVFAELFKIHQLWKRSQRGVVESPIAGLEESNVVGEPGLDPRLFLPQPVVLQAQSVADAELESILAMFPIVSPPPQQEQEVWIPRFGQWHEEESESTLNLKKAFRALRWMKLLGRCRVIIPLSVWCSILHPKYPISFTNAILEAVLESIRHFEENKMNQTTPDSPKGEFPQPTPLLYSPDEIWPMLATLETLYVGAEEAFIAARHQKHRSKSRRQRRAYSRFVELASHLLAYACGVSLPGSVAEGRAPSGHLLEEMHRVEGSVHLPPAEERRLWLLSRQVDSIVQHPHSLSGMMEEVELKSRPFVRLSLRTPFVLRIVSMLSIAGESKSIRHFDVIAPKIATSWLQSVICPTEEEVKMFGVVVLNRVEFLSKLVPYIMPSLWAMMDHRYARGSILAYSLLLTSLGMQRGGTTDADVKGSVHPIKVHVHSAVDVFERKDSSFPSTPEVYEAKSVGELYFASCIASTFEDPNWQMRYAAVERGFGLLSKLSSGGGIADSLDPMPIFGLVLMHMTRMMMDDEAHVRSKAHQLLLTLGRSQMQFALRCFGALMEEASVLQRAVLAKLAYDLVQRFSTLIVLSWEYVVGVLDAQSSDGGASTSTAALLMDKEAIHWESFQNIVASVALLQLTHCDSLEGVPLREFFTLLEARMMHCHARRERARIEQQGTLDVKHDLFISVYTEGVKQLLDANQTVGSHVVQRVLKTIHDAFASSDWDRGQLKSWLELLHVLVFKYTMNMESSHINDLMFNTMQVMVRLLNDYRVNDENRTLVVIVCQAFAERSTRSGVALLHEQLRVLLRLCIFDELRLRAAGIDTEEEDLSRSGLLGGTGGSKTHTELPSQVSTRGKQFLQVVLRRLKGTGLFVMLYSMNLREFGGKEQPVTDERFFHLIQELLLGGQLDTGDPVWDIFYHLFESGLNPNMFSTVIRNLCYYVSRAYSDSLPVALLDEASTFFKRFMSSVFPVDMDLTYILDFAVTIMKLGKNHPQRVQICVPVMEHLFRHALQHGVVQGRCAHDFALAHCMHRWNLLRKRRPFFAEDVAKSIASIFRGFDDGASVAKLAPLALSYVVLLLEDLRILESQLEVQQKRGMAEAWRQPLMTMLATLTPSAALSVTKDKQEVVASDDTPVFLVGVTDYLSVCWTDMVDFLGSSNNNPTLVPVKEAVARFVVRWCRYSPSWWSQLLPSDAGRESVTAVTRTCHLLNYIILQLVVLNKIRGEEDGNGTDDEEEDVKTSLLNPRNIAMALGGDVDSHVIQLARPALHALELCAGHRSLKSDVLHAVKVACTNIKCLVHYLSFSEMGAKVVAGMEMEFWLACWEKMQLILLKDDGTLEIQGGESRDALWIIFLDWVTFCVECQPRALPVIQPLLIGVADQIRHSLGKTSLLEESTNNRVCIRRLLTYLGDVVNWPTPPMSETEASTALLKDVGRTYEDI